MPSNGGNRWLVAARYVLSSATCVTVAILTIGLTIGEMGVAHGQEGRPKGFVGTKSVDMCQRKPCGETCWKGSGTNAPNVAGCHQEILKDGKLGRTFSEECEGNILIDHTPGEGQGSCPPGYHPHKNDAGHPSKIDCNVFCGGKQGAKDKGTCTLAPAPAPCKGNSAFCKCS